MQPDFTYYLQPTAYNLPAFPPNPSYRITYHPQWPFLLVHRVQFMAGPEINDSALPNRPTHRTAEPFSCWPAFFKNYLIRFRDMKRLIIHFGLRYRKSGRKAPGNRV